MHSNTTDQNIDNNTTLIINNHDVESDDSLLYGEGSVVQKRAKNEGDINKRERRSLEKMSIWTFLNRLMVTAIEEEISKKLEGTGVTIDDLFYTSVDELKGKPIDLQDLIEVPYSRIHETMIEMIKKMIDSKDIPTGMETTMPQLVDEYIDLIKNHYGLTLFNLIDKKNYNDNFLLPFLPWLKELSFSDNDKNPIVDDNLTLEKLEVAEVHSPLRRLCEIYPSKTYSIEQQLIRIKFNIACLENDWEKAIHYLNELPNTINIMQEDLSPLIFYYDNDADQKISFLNSLWGKITSNMHERAKVRTLSLWLQSCIEKSNLLVADWIWSKTENTEAQRALLTKRGRGITHGSMIYEIILEKNDVSALDWVWKKGGELNIQRAMLALGDVSEGIKFSILDTAIGQGKKEIVVFLYSKAGELNGGVQREVLPEISLAIAHGYDKIVDFLWKEAEKLGGQDLQHEILKAENYKLLGMIIKSVNPSNAEVATSFLNKALPLLDIESVAKNASFQRIIITDQHLDNCLKLLEKSNNHEAINWMQHFISKRREFMQSRTREVPPSSRKKNKCSISRKKREAVWMECLLGEDEEVDKEKTGIEVNKKNLAGSEIDNEKLKAYQEDLNNRLDKAIAQSDENAQNLIKEEQDQLNKLILEIQEAQAISSFYMLSVEFESQEFNDKLLSITKSVNDEAISSESLQYFKQVIKINLLKTVLPLIGDRNFKNLLLNNPEKLIQDQSILNNVFTGLEEAVFKKYNEQQLKYEDFEELESNINQKISSISGEIEHIANQDINKSYLSNYVSRSMGLNLVLLENISDISSNLQNKICYETLVSLGALIHDHENHIKANHHGHKHNPHMDSLKSRIENSELLSIAHDLYYLHKSEGNVNQDELKSKVIKAKINSYSSVDSNYIINNLFNQFSSEEIKNIFKEENLKSFSDEFETYEKEVITIHSTQVFTSYAAIQIGIKDNIGHDKNIIIDNVGDIKNPSSFRLDEKNLVITLKLGSEEYIVTGKLEGENTKYYLNIAGYKTKIGGLISSFASEEKREIHNRLKQLNDKIELLESKKSIENIADTEISDESQQNIINEIKQDLLAKGVREETFNQLNEQLENMNKEFYTKHVDEVGKSLAKNNIEFDRSKFELAKIKGAKGGKFMSVLAIYDLFDSTQDLTGLKDAGSLQAIFGINGILDAMDDVRESFSIYREGRNSAISRNSKLGKITAKIPSDMRKAFVKIIHNPIVSTITFATIAYQFGYSIDQIVKGENVELNAYFATSSGIKLASMSMRPMSMGVMAVTRGLGAASKVLKGLSIASNVLGKLSIVTMVADVGIAAGVAIHERMEYTKAIAREIPLLTGDEQAEVFFAKVIKFFTGRDVEQEYEDIIRIKSYLTALKVIAIKSLDNNPNIAAVVQYITSIEERYDEVIKGGKFTCTGAGLGASTCAQSCTLEKIYTDPSFGKINSAMNENLFSLNISKTLPLELHTLVMTKWWEEFECEVTKGFNTKKGIECFKALHDKQVYLSPKKPLLHITQDEYNNGLRVVSMPLQLSKNHTYNQRNNVAYSEAGYGQCNTGKIHKVHEKKYTFSGEPFIFTKEPRSGNTILYLPGPQELIAAANYPAVMHISKANSVDEVCYDNYNHWQGSKNHESTFIVSDKSTLATITGGEAKAEKNVLVMNANPNYITVDLNIETIHYDAPKCSFHHIVYPNIILNNVYNYFSHSTAQQDITTHCKTRYVNAGGGNRGNTVKQGSANCKDEDYEVRVVHKNDVHYRGSKQVIFVVNKNSDNAIITVDNNFNTNKNSANIIRLEGLGIEKLRIKEAEGYYNLTLLTDDGQATSIKVVDDLKNLVIYTEGNQTIFVQGKSLPDLIRDMYYQKLNRSGEYVDDNVLENSKIKLKAVILKEIDNKEVTPWTAKYIADKSNDLGIPSQVVVTKHRKKELIEQAVIHDTYDNDIYVDLSASGDFKFGYQFSYIESIKTKDENTTIFGFLDGSRVYLNRNGHKTGYVFDETRSISDIIADGDYQDIVNELNTTIPIKFGDEVLIIGTKGDDILHNDPNYKSHLVGNGGKDRYVIDMNLNDFSIPEVTIYDPNNPIVDISNLSNKLKDKFGGDPIITYNNERVRNRWFELQIRIEKGALDESTARNTIKYILDNNILSGVIAENVLTNNTLQDIIKDTTVPSKRLSRRFISSEELENRLNRYITDTFLRNFLDGDRFGSGIKGILKDISDKDYLTLRVKIEQCKGDTYQDIGFMSRNVICMFNERMLGAVEGGAISQVKNLIIQGADLSVQNDNGNTPLHLACKNCSYDMVKYLIEEKDARINAKNKDGKTPLDLANECEQSEEKKKVIDVFRTEQSKSGSGLGELLRVNIRHGNLTGVRKLIGRGANVHAQNKYKTTPLNLASFYKKTEIVVYLAKNDANIEDPDGRGNLPLHLASLNGNLDTVKYLVDNCGANLNAADYEGNTALHIAVRNVHLSNVHLSIAKYLIARGADVNAADYDGDTALHIAVRNVHLSIAKYLVARGADVNARNNRGNTPLYLAVLYNQLKIIEYLVNEKRTNLNIKNNLGETPLDLATEESNTDIIEVLKQAHGEKTPIQRRRRYHHGDHNRHSEHLSREPLAIDLSNQPEIATSSASRQSSWINDGVAWMKESITNTYKTTRGTINWLFNKDKTPQKMESAARFEDIKTWNKENNESFNENVEEETPKNVVGFCDKILGRLNKVDVKKLQDLCKEFKIKWNAKGDTHKYMQNIASLLNSACDVEGDYASNSCSNSLVERIEQVYKLNNKSKQLNEKYQDISNLCNQDNNIILLTCLLRLYFKIKSKDEEDIHGKICKVAYQVLKVTKACKKINEYIHANISEDDIYTLTLGEMIISGNATKDEIVEALFSSLENLIERKLEEDRNKEESSKIEEFMEKCKVYVENVLGIVAEDIIDYNSKLSEKKSYEHKELCNKVEQQSTLKKIQPVSDTNANVKRAVPKFFTECNNRLQPTLVVPTSIKKSEKLSQLLTENSLKQLPLLNNNLSLIDINRPTSSLNNIFVMSGNIAQVGSFL